MKLILNTGMRFFYTTEWLHRKVAKNSTRHCKDGWPLRGEGWLSAPRNHKFNPARPIYVQVQFKSFLKIIQKRLAALSVTYRYSAVFEAMCKVCRFDIWIDVSWPRSYLFISHFILHITECYDHINMFFSW